MDWLVALGLGVILVVVYVLVKQDRRAKQPVEGASGGGVNEQKKPDKV